MSGTELEVELVGVKSVRIALTAVFIPLVTGILFIDKTAVI
jgi:hypothetical protein